MNKFKIKIMKTLIKTISFLLLSILMFSCSNDDNEKKPSYLLETVTSSVSGLQTKITYNDQNLPTHLDYYTNNSVTQVADVTYDENNRINKITNTDSFTTYSYNSNGKIDKKTSYDVNGATQTITSISEYLYSGQSVIILDKTPSNVLDGKSEYIFDANQNLIEVKNYTVNASNPNGLYTGSFYLSNYDDKYTPFKSLPPAIAFPLVSRNNYRTTISSDNTTSSITYSYNDAGYPISSVSSVLSEVTSYQYLIR